HIALDADLPDEAERYLDEAQGVLATPGYADGAPAHDPRAALVHRGRAVWLRRTGRPQEAVEACRTALDALGAADPTAGPTVEQGRAELLSHPEAVVAEAHVLVLETLSATYGDMGAYESAVHAEEAAHAIVTRGSGADAAPSAQTAQSAQRLANSLL